MKRFLILAAAMFVACAVEEDEMNLVNPKSPVRFYAEVEGFDSRTHVDAQGLTCWNADDRITIYTGETYNREFAFDGEDGAPSGGYDQVSVDKTFYSAYDVDANYAIYPHQASNQLKPYSTSDPSQGGYFVATLPAEQTYAEGSFGRGAFTMVAVTQDVGDGRLIFKNVGGCIVLSLYGADQPIVRVTVEGRNSEKLAGKAHIAHKNGGLPTATMQSTATSSVSVVSESGVTVGTTAETATEFWLAVPPTTFENGFTITVEGADGTTYTKSTSKKQSVERNVFLMMPAIEVDFWGEGSSVIISESQKLYYTTTDGNPLSFSEGMTTGAATLVSHNYADGQGVMIFDQEITTINGYMFSHIYTLETITFPSTLKVIGDLAFWCCTNLQNVTLPEGLETLGMGAFTGCESFTSVTLPESLTNTDENLFRNCASLAEFKGKYASEDGRCLIIDGVLNSFAPADLTSFTIPDGVVRVGEDSFNGCANLTAVTIPEGVEELGNWVFWQCTALTSIEIPASVTQIGQQCFGGCTLLSEIYCNPTTPPALELFYGPWSAFEEIAEGAKIYVPAESVEAYKTAEGWSEYADMICAKPQPTNEIWYTSTDGEIVEPYDATVFGANIISNSYETGQGVITFDGPVTEIGRYAFSGRSYISSSGRRLLSIKIPNSVKVIGYEAFSYSRLENIELGTGVTKIEDWAFSDCQYLTSLTIPNSVEEIGSSIYHKVNGGHKMTAFYGKFASEDNRCLIVDGELNSFASVGLTEYTIPEGVTSIGDRAFIYCYNLTNIVIPDGVTSIGMYAFSQCSSLTSITIPDSVTSIENMAFHDCRALRNISIPDNVTSIAEEVFVGCDALSAFYGKYASEDNRCLIVDGVLNSFAPANLTEYTITESVTSIENYAFWDCHVLTSITIPDNVTSIGYYAFGYCNSLKDIYCKATIPPTAFFDSFTRWNAFNNIAEDATIYVPASDDDSIINAYKAAAGWSAYADLIEEYEFTE